MNKEKVASVLKWVSLVALPLIATFWIAISEIWGLPYGQQIGATITALDALLGGLVGTKIVNKSKEA